MWNWKPAKAMLDRLWNRGQLVIAGRQGFQRLYDLPERVIPQERAGCARSRRARAARGARAQGGRTRAGPSPSPGSSSTGVSAEERNASAPSSMRSSATALLERVQVDDGGPPALVAPADPTSTPAAPSTAAFLSPFDNLLWDRPFARRMLGFDHLIEVYKPEHAAPVRLLRAPVALARPHRRPCRPEVRPQRRDALVSGVPLESAQASRAGRRDRPGAREAPPIVGAERVER